MKDDFFATSGSFQHRLAQDACHDLSSFRLTAMFLLTDGAHLPPFRDDGTADNASIIHYDSSSFGIQPASRIFLSMN